MMTTPTLAPLAAPLKGAVGLSGRLF